MIAEKDFSKTIDHLCYPTFGSAVYSMKRSNYCSKSDQELADEVLLDAAEFRNSRSYKNCYLAKFPETQMTGIVKYNCPSGFPYMILTGDKSDRAVKGCSSRWKNKVKEMRSHPNCN